MEFIFLYFLLLVLPTERIIARWATFRSISGGLLLDDRIIIF